MKVLFSDVIELDDEGFGFICDEIESSDAGAVEIILPDDDGDNIIWGPPKTTYSTVLRFVLIVSHVKSSWPISGEDEVKSLKVQIVEQLHGSGQDLSKIQQRAREPVDLAERVKKLVQQTKFLLEDLEDLDPPADEGYSPATAKTKAYGVVQQVEPPRLSEKDDEFMDLIQALL
ncbi:hypothetical protein KC342_g16919 [Hortaea werneckii]|nr:hypothetical protein KC342_g16919 [Hortaea werneckii]KAI7392710.1 hypothetical protein KC328_g6893 [Hortaea werneckii]